VGAVAAEVGEASFLARAPRRPELAPFVEQLWVFRTPGFGHHLERIVPDGRAQLLVNLAEDELRTWDAGRPRRFAGSVLEGPFDHPFVIDTSQQRAILGVNLTLTGVGGWLPAGEVVGRRVDLHALGLPRIRESLVDAPTDAARLDRIEDALARVFEAAREDRAMVAAARALAGGVRVGAVHARLGMSARTFQRRFRRQVGLGPKRFARVRRIQALLARLDGANDWSGLAHELGFSDQAHLVREFRALTGVTPTAYAPRASGDRNHIVL